MHSPLLLYGRGASEHCLTSPLSLFTMQRSATAGFCHHHDGAWRQSLAPVSNPATLKQVLGSSSSSLVHPLDHALHFFNNEVPGPSRESYLVEIEPEPPPWLLQNAQSFSFLHTFDLHAITIIATPAMTTATTTATTTAAATATDTATAAPCLD